MKHVFDGKSELIITSVVKKNALIAASAKKIGSMDYLVFIFDLWNRKKNTG